MANTLFHRCQDVIFHNGVSVGLGGVVAACHHYNHIQVWDDEYALAAPAAGIERIDLLAVVSGGRDPPGVAVALAAAVRRRDADTRIVSIMNAPVDPFREKMSRPNDWNKRVIEEFRANQGVVGGRYENMRLLLLHTPGAKSGKPHLNPVAYIKDGDRFVIIASKRGAPTNPDWYHNLVAHPEVTIEVGTETVQARAEVVPEPARAELYTRMAAKYPGFAEYERRTDRIIPLISLSRLP